MGVAPEGWGVLRYGVMVWLMLCTAGVFSGVMVSARAAAPASPAAGNVAQAGGNPLWTIPLNSLTATRERPLFTPSRRPPQSIPLAPVSLAPPPPPPKAEGPEQFPLQLIGTIAGGELSFAICLNLATNDVVRLKTGESFEGWALRTVRGREATFEKASRREVVALPSPEDAQRPPLAPVAGAAPRLPLPPGTAALVQPVAAKPAAAPPNASQGSGTWRDGDGNLIAPPKH